MGRAPRGGTARNGFGICQQEQEGSFGESSVSQVGGGVRGGRAGRRPEHKMRMLLQDVLDGLQMLSPIFYKDHSGCYRENSLGGVVQVAIKSVHTFVASLGR